MRLVTVLRPPTLKYTPQSIPWLGPVPLGSKPLIFLRAFRVGRGYTYPGESCWHHPRPLCVDSISGQAPGADLRQAAPAMGGWALPKSVHAFRGPGGHRWWAHSGCGERILPGGNDGLESSERVRPHRRGGRPVPGTVSVNDNVTFWNRAEAPERVARHRQQRRCPGWVTSGLRPVPNRRLAPGAQDTLRLV